MTIEKMLPDGTRVSVTGDPSDGGWSKNVMSQLKLRHGSEEKPAPDDGERTVFPETGTGLSPRRQTAAGEEIELPGQGSSSEFTGL